jgi:GntR family transcriptional regulator
LRFGAERYARSLRQETGLSPYRAQVSRQGRVASVDCTSITRITAPAEIAERLLIDAEVETVVRRENWYT